MSQLSDQVIIVTGASRGIGAAAALELARNGAKLCLSARSASSCSGILEQIKNAGGEAFAASCDVSDYAAVEKMIAETLDRYGRIDALINNAGIVDPIGEIATSEPEAWARNISINLVGVYNGTRAVLPHFLNQNAGVIINISSGAAHGPMEGWSAYCSGKAGVYMMTRATALETGEKGVRVYGFAPGVVDTDMQGTIRASGINVVSKIPREDLAPAEDPAKAIAWLCSEDASDLAGQELSIRDETLRKRIGLSV
ncbi:SDR family oxidoreductase [Sneathiella sp. CAU 1612]|uniref:SDR family oxidoreductase n=1 Tax=Sneathiella sedimenti TaxID=2816034 RepID=A0ABS3F6S5_9PROT|nr:SDR family oxidoreductase [Sneathiella sedimenti]MBO0334186.1 SDR family oxidoreductase [Sneathiella sedimenti]